MKTFQVVSGVGYGPRYAEVISFKKSVYLPHCEKFQEGLSKMGPQAAGHWF